MTNPYFFSRALGVSLLSLGTNFGLRSCWDRDGRDTYGRSCVDALHSYE